MERNALRGFKFTPKKLSSTATFICPLTEGRIDRDLCLDAQNYVDGYRARALEFEEFSEKENYRKICNECMYHI